jgi:hypothetical protein
MESDVLVTTVTALGGRTRNETPTTYAVLTVVRQFARVRSCCVEPRDRGL